MTINLDTLLERKQATEDQIVTYLVAHFYEPMRHLAQTILHDALAADDVAQETLLKAANRIHQYEPHSNLKAWVYRIGLNEARVQLRWQGAPAVAGLVQAGDGGGNGRFPRPTRNRQLHLVRWLGNGPGL